MSERKANRAMLGLGTRLSVSGGRESLVRLATTAVGIAVGVGLLLTAVAAFPALHAHDQRGAWLLTSAHNRRPAQDESHTDPALWLSNIDRFDGRDLERIDVAALGPRAPVSPGLRRLPVPGEMFVSPALARLLRDTPRTQLADRFTGHRVVGVIGRAGLVAPNSLVAVVGDSRTTLRHQPGVETIRSIESAPRSHGFSQFMRIVLVIGALALIIPVIVFVSTSTRLSAARREQRFAALRLAGATPTQTATVAAIEAAIAAIAGAALGFGLFYALRPSIARLPLDGLPYFTSDWRLAPGWAAVIALGVPLLAVAAATISLRRVQISPLGVQRRARPQLPTARRLVPLALGLVGFLLIASGAVASRRNNDLLYPMVASFVLVILGVAVAGPWLTLVTSRLLARRSQRAATLVAARRLSDDPRAGFRAISGLILAVFVASLFNGLSPAVLAEGGNQQFSTSLARGAVVGVYGPITVDADGGIKVTGDPLHDTVGGLSSHQVDSVTRRVRAEQGVSSVAALHTAPPELEPNIAASKLGFTPTTAVATCAALRRIARATTCGPAASVVAFDVFDLVENSSIRIEPAHVTPSRVDRLPVLAIVAVTDRRTATVERLRTDLDSVRPAALVRTPGEVRATDRYRLVQLQRLIDVALLVTFLIAGCSLAVAVAGSLVERKRPFALLRLTGMRLAELRRVILVEAAAPLLAVALVSAGLGLLVAQLILSIAGRAALQAPSLAFTGLLGGGLLGALAIVAATLPLLGRVTSLESARFE